jgi:anti-sigma factor RsiW
MIYDADTLKEMIPLYVNGQLTEQEKKAFTQGLAEHPELAAEVAEFKAIEESYRDLEAETPFPNQDRLFSKIISQIDREETATGKQKAGARDASPGLREKLVDFFHTTFISPKVAWSVVAVQIVLLVTLLVAMPGRSTFQTLTAPGHGIDERLTLNVVFDETAVEKEIRALLVKTGATIVGGPSANGLYIVAIPRDQSPEEISGILLRSGIVSFVEQRY